jgi:hypothetical protein
MHMVSHDDIPVEVIVSQTLIPIVNRFHHHLRDFRKAKILWAGTSVVEDAVHRKEGLSGGAGGRKTAIRRKATLQAPGEEDGLADGMIVRQATGVEGSHEWIVGAWENILREGSRPIDNRPQVDNLPHRLPANALRRPKEKRKKKKE